MSPDVIAATGAIQKPLIGDLRTVIPVTADQEPSGAVNVEWFRHQCWLRRLDDRTAVGLNFNEH